MSEEIKAEEKKVEEPQTFSADYVKELRAEAANYRTQLKGMSEKLDALTTEQERAKEAQLAEQGQFQELATQKGAELEKAMSRLSTMESQLEEYKQRDEAELKELLSKIPEGLGEEFEGDSIPLSTKLSLARKLAGKKEALHTTKLPGEGDAEISSRSELKTSADKAAYINKHGRAKYLALPEN